MDILFYFLRIHIIIIVIIIIIITFLLLVQYCNLDLDHWKV